MKEELIMEKHELVDRDGNKTGKILDHIDIRDENNIPQGYYISVTGVVILNNKNEVLLQKRSGLKRVNPNKWGICGGKVNYQETTEEACIRETFEEIGVVLEKENLKYLSMDINSYAHFVSYYIKQDVDINKCKLQKEEVEEVKYFKIEELMNLDNEGFEWIDNLKRIFYTK